MTKKRLLLCGEYSSLNSGYANWSRNLLNGLNDLNKYELAELACFCTVNETKNKKHKWKVYANSVSPSDERYKNYKSNNNNTYGQWRFDAVCLDFKPDIVIDFRDPWMFDFSSLVLSLSSFLNFKNSDVACSILEQYALRLSFTII